VAHAQIACRIATPGDAVFIRFGGRNGHHKHAARAAFQNASTLNKRD